MLTKHITQQIEPYLDQQLSAEEQELVEAHLAVCPNCARRLFDARRLKHELGPVMQRALGRPMPSLTLRHRVRHILNTGPAARPARFNWAIPARILNTVGTLAIIVLLAVAVLTVIQGQLPGPNVLPELSSSRPDSADGEPGSAATNTPSPAITPQAVATSVSKHASLGDTLPRPDPLPFGPAIDSKITAEPASLLSQGQNDPETPVQPELPDKGNSPGQTIGPELPGGTIAFSFFNRAAYRQVYEVHLISPDGSNHRLFPLDGVSEPALHLTETGYQLAFRAWSEPTSPRSLLTSNLAGEDFHRIGGFWEDAQPDWSPTEDRIIFASQRESDRRWRLYTIWSDGSAEKNLRREGKSPTFAPDGYRFAFESCDETGNRCGLWLADLDHSEYGAQPFLEEPLARSPDWAPAGEQIAYMANPGGNWDLYLVNSDGSQVRRLTTDPAIDGLPAWSPDGQWLAFLSDRGGNWGIWLLHLASGDVRQVFSFDGGVFNPPQRDPYGDRNWWDEQLSWSR